MNEKEQEDGFMGKRTFDVDLIASRMRTIIEETGLTLGEFGARLGGVSADAVRRWTVGKTTPTSYYLFLVCSETQVDPAWLLGLTDERRVLE